MSRPLEHPCVCTCAGPSAWTGCPFLSSITSSPAELLYLGKPVYLVRYSTTPFPCNYLVICLPFFQNCIFLDRRDQFGQVPGTPFTLLFWSYVPGVHPELVHSSHSGRETMNSPFLCSLGLSKAPGKEALKCSVNQWHLYMWPFKCYKLARKPLRWRCSV